jgi:predicted ATPase
MLTSFSAQNFRQFSNLEISHLERINLFVGRNNAGKSALLEALEVYINNASPQTLINLVTAREETWNAQSRPSSRYYNADSIRHLFKGHVFPKFEEKGFIVGPINDPAAQIRVTTAAYRTIETDNSTQRLRVEPSQLKMFEDEVEFELVAIEGSKIRRLINFGALARNYRPPGLEVEARMPLQVVPTRSLAPRRVAALWDAIGLTDLSEEVVSGLRLIEPLVKDIAFVESPSTSGGFNRETEARIPLARVAGQVEPLPLRSMGDGITRLFHISLALANAKDGVLLVDEFENGLHWSVQEKVWATVFRLAESLNVQVFASTHSRDCVRAFQQAWADHPKSGAFFRLENDGEGNITAQPYSLERLTDAEDVDAEVR